MAKFNVFIVFITILTPNLAISVQCNKDVDQTSTTVSLSKQDDYNERLFIKPLLDGKLFAQFQFESNFPLSIKELRWANKLGFFPLSLADLVRTTDLNELYFSLNKGNWNHHNWGYLNTPGPPGAQIRVKFSQHNENHEKSWNRLVNSLAGKYCASLSSANKKTLVYSKLIFDSYYSNLPEETLCTENLTPWKKSLPCTISGLTSLLNAVNLLKSSYSSINMHLRPNLSGGVKLTHSISIVFNPLHLFEGKQLWSLIKIFGSQVNRQCPIAKSSFVLVDITDLDDKTKLYPNSYNESIAEGRKLATFDVHSLVNHHQGKQLNVGIKQTKIFKQPAHSLKPIRPVHFTTHIAGVGAIDGTVVASVKNNLKQPLRISYMHAIPHFLPIYLHTLTIKTKSTDQEQKPDKLNYNLSRDGTPTLIEFSVVVPAESEIVISYDFDRAFLRWTEYRPDANKGILLGSAIIDVPINDETLRQHLIVPQFNSFNEFNSSHPTKNHDEGFIRIFARPLLIILPTPDFSMPYNVICMVCSLLVTAVAPLYCMNTIKPKGIRISREDVKESKKEK